MDGVSRGSVVVAALDDDQAVTLDPVDQAVLAVNAAGPVAGKIAFQWFRLAGSIEGMASAFLDQAVEFPEGRTIIFDPVLKMLPSTILEQKLHSSS